MTEGSRTVTARITTPARQGRPPTDRVANSLVPPKGWAPLDDYDPEISRRATGLIPQAYEGCSCVQCKSRLGVTE